MFGASKRLAFGTASIRSKYFRARRADHPGVGSYQATAPKFECVGGPKSAAQARKRHAPNAPLVKGVSGRGVPACESRRPIAIFVGGEQLESMLRTTGIVKVYRIA